MSTAFSADASSGRLHTIMPTDHTAYIVITTAAGLAVLPVFGLIRYFIRRATEHGADDILLASFAVTIAQSGVILRASSFGLGQSMAEPPAERVLAAEQV